MIYGLEIKLTKELITFHIVNEFIYPWKRVYVLHRNLVERPIVYAHDPSPIFLWNEDDWTSTRIGFRSDVTFVDQILNLSVNLFILDNGSSINRCVRK